MKRTSWIALLMTILMIGTMVMSAVPALAADPYTAISPTVTAAGLGLKEKLEVSQPGMQNPEVTYTLTLGNMVVFTDSGVTYGDDTQVDSTAVDGKVLATVHFATGEIIGKSTATKDYTVPESIIAAINALSFDRPGIYYWNITKTEDCADTQLTNYNKSSVSDTGTALVVRVDSNADELKDPVVSINVLGTDGRPTGNKDAVYEDNYPAAPGSLSLKKEVTGNQGARDQYFKFDVTLNGMTDFVGGKLTPTGDNTVNSATAKYGEDFGTSFNNLGEVTIRADGSAIFTFWLKDGEEIQIPNIPQFADLTYTITESKNDGYTVTYSNTGFADGDSTDANTLNGKTTKSATEKVDNVRVVFKNNKGTSTPTGVILTVAPAIGVIALGGAGIGVLALGKKRKDEDAE